MRIRRRPAIPLILLFSLASIVVASNTDKSQTTDVVGSSQAQDVLQSPSLITGKLGSKGTKFAPVDGKDGRPHAGPWVDTEDRKKADPSAKEPSNAEKQAQLINKPVDPSVLDEIPQSNDGVMDDPKRESPKVGTTGTEGGITEKDKARKAKEGQTGERVEKIPDSPKEALPPPDQPTSKDASKKANQKDSGVKDGKKDVKKEEKDEALGGLEKPADLPQKPHDVPHPVPDSANKDHLDVSQPDSKSPKQTPDAEEVEGIIQPFHSYILALSMILFSEIGDKTFLIAALMAMKHDRMLVFSAALSALIAMTVLSAILGHAAPLLFPKRFTNFLASGLFLVFGIRMLREGLALSSDEGVGEEMKEVEMELAEKEHQARKQRRRSSISPYALEMGMGGRTRKSRSSSRLPEPPRSPSSSPDRSPQRGGSINSATVGLSNLCSLLLSPAWVQTFIMTFLGEWGDRSQIATIAMAAGQDYWWVTSGAISGHAMCTGVAVIGGRAIAGKVSLRVVTLGGAIAFLVFGVIYLLEAFYYP